MNSELSLQSDLDPFGSDWLKPPQESEKEKKDLQKEQQNEKKNNPNDYNEPTNVFLNYQEAIRELTSTQYSISIFTSNISHLEQEYEKKHKIFMEKEKELEKIKKMNKKTIEAIEAKNHETQNLKKSIKKNEKELNDIEEKTKSVFAERLKSQEIKNELYEHYKSLEEEYNSKLEEFNRFSFNEELENEVNEESNVSERLKKSSRKVEANIITPEEQLKALREENENTFPYELEKVYQEIEKLEEELEKKLHKRQLTKESIKKYTENIKAYEEEQYECQLEIETLEKQIDKLSIDEKRINEKKEYMQELMDQINELRHEIDEKNCEQNDLLKYLKEVEKEEKKMRKLRKIQVECEKEQDLYRRERAERGRFAIIESEQDMEEKINEYSRELKYSSEKHKEESNQKNKQVQTSRIDPKTNQAIIGLIERYEKLKSK